MRDVSLVATVRSADSSDRCDFASVVNCASANLSNHFVMQEVIKTMTDLNLQHRRVPTSLLRRKELL